MTCDLIDDEDIDPNWVQHLSDPVDSTPVRSEVIELISQAKRYADRLGQTQVEKVA